MIQLELFSEYAQGEMFPEMYYPWRTPLKWVPPLFGPMMSYKGWFNYLLFGSGPFQQDLPL